MLAAYPTSKSAAWSFTNALRIELRGQKTAVLGLHVSFMDTVLADDFTREVKRSLSDGKPIYLDPPPLG
jgi:short-subunit dehydrogenase